VDHERLAMQLLDAVADYDQTARRAVAQRIDAARCWRGVAHYLAGYAAGYQEAAEYHHDTGRCLADDTVTFTAAPPLTAVA
jgi:hypothetical protein